MLAKLRTFALLGIDAVPVEVEVDAVPAEPELRADARPRQRREQLGVGLLRRRQGLRPEHRSGRERQPAALQEFPPVKRHSPPGS